MAPTLALTETAPGEETLVREASVLRAVGLARVASGSAQVVSSINKKILDSGIDGSIASVDPSGGKVCKEGPGSGLSHEVSGHGFVVDNGRIGESMDGSIGGDRHGALPGAEDGS